MILSIRYEKLYLVLFFLAILNKKLYHNNDTLVQVCPVVSAQTEDI